MPFGQHLRADENANLIAIDLRQRRLELAFASHAVSIDPRERHAGKQPLDSLFNALCALADGLYRVCAYRTRVLSRLLRAAVMTDELTGVAMHREMRIAALA